MTKKNIIPDMVKLSRAEEKLLSEQIKLALFKLGLISYQKSRCQKIKPTKRLRQQFKLYRVKNSYNLALFYVIRDEANRCGITDSETIQTAVDYAIQNGKVNN